jgi:hypothetical protein
MVSSAELQDGTVAAITLSIGAAPNPILVPVNASHDPWASFGSPGGLSLPGFMDDGSVWVTNRLFRVYISSVNQ